MAQVSRSPLTPQMWSVIWQYLIRSMSRTKQAADYEIFLKGLLSKTEQVMLAKRLMVCLLSRSGWDVVDIAYTLKMSTSTIYKIHAQCLNNAQFTQLLTRLYPVAIPFNNKQTSKSFWDLLFKEIIVSKTERYRRLKQSI